MEDTEITFSPKKKLFKLCFVPKCALGRSYVQVNRPLNAVLPFAPKAYNNEYAHNTENLNKHIEKLIVKGPKEKYKRPKTENQMYGWYDLKPKKYEPMLHHGRQLDQLLRENMMNFAKIRI